MNITKTFTTSGEIKYVQIDDEGVVYVIPVQTLHAPVYLDTLLAQGWELTSLPYGFMKDGVTLQNLPSEEKPLEAFTIEEQQEILDMSSVSVYDDVTLRAKLSTRAIVEYVRHRPSANTIKTRQEFLNFLDAFSLGEIASDDYRSYLPLNSFVAKDALYNYEEYFNPENSFYRSVIEGMRHLTVDKFRKLSEWMMDQKLIQADYTPKGLIDAYMSWGIPGMNLRFTEVRNIRETYILGVPNRNRMNVDLENLPFVYDRDLAIIDSSGQLTYPKGKDSYQMTLSDKGKSDLIKSLGNQHTKYGKTAVGAVPIQNRIEDPVTVFEGEVTAKYNESIIVLETHYSTHRVPILEVTFDGSKTTLVNPENYNFVYNEQVTEKILNEIYIRSIVRLILDKKIERVDVSTRKALEKVSVSPGAAVSYILSHPDTKQELDAIEEENEVKKEFRATTDLIQHIRFAKAYLQGKLNAEQLTSSVRDVLDQFLTNNLNVDDIARGISRDASSNSDVLYRNIYVANKVLGVSLDKIYEAASKVTMDTDEFVIDTGNYVVVTPLTKRTSTAAGYNADVMTYIKKQAEEAFELHYVTTAFRELGVPDRGAGYQKHCAVETLTFCKYNLGAGRNGKVLYEEVRRLIVSNVEANINYARLYLFEDRYDVYAAQCIFSLVQLGYYDLKIDGQTIRITDAGLAARLQYAVMVRFDTLISLTENSVGENGKFQLHIVNASIIDSVVVPHKNITIKEKPIFWYWEGTNDPEMAAKLTAAGHFPNQNWLGMRRIYEWMDLPATGQSNDYLHMHAIFHHGDDETEVMENPLAMYAYLDHCNHWKDTWPNTAEPRSPLPYHYTILPTVYVEEMEDYLSKLPVPATNADYKWKVGPVRDITQEIIYNEFPELRNYSNPALVTREELEARYPALEFNQLEAEDIYIMDNVNEILNINVFTGTPVVYQMGSPFLTAVRGEQQVRINLADLEQYAGKGEFAIKHLYGRKYLFKDYRGRIYKAVI